MIEAPENVFSVCFAVELTVNNATSGLEVGVVPAGKPFQQRSDRLCAGRALTRARPDRLAAENPPARLVASATGFREAEAVFCFRPRSS